MEFDLKRFLRSIGYLQNKYGDNTIFYHPYIDWQFSFNDKYWFEKFTPPFVDFTSLKSTIESFIKGGIAVSLEKLKEFKLKTEEWLKEPHISIIYEINKYTVISESRIDNKLLNIYTFENTNDSHNNQDIILQKIKEFRNAA